MKIAYLVNQYPKTSHSFIRREIAALEELGVCVARFSIRAVTDLVDESDLAEQKRTTVILHVGFVGLLAAVAAALIRHPQAFLRTFHKAVRLGYGSDRGVLYHLIYLAEACVLLGHLKRHGLTHVHAHFGTNSTTVALLCHHLGGTSYSFTVHGPEEFDKPLALRLPEKIECAGFVIAISEFGRSQLYRWCPHSCWSRIHVVHCGLDAQWLIEPSVGVSNSPRFVCIGRLCEQKGQLLLVEAAARLVSGGDKIECVLVGDGEMRRDIERLVDRYQLREHVRITGWVSNASVKEELINSRALVLASFAEGIPVAVMEAMALGRPVVSTYVSGIPELVESGRTGWLCPAGALEPLVQAIREVIYCSPQELDKMGRAGWSRVREQHDAMREAQKLIELFANHKKRSDGHNTILDQGAKG